MIRTAIRLGAEVARAARARVLWALGLMLAFSMTEGIGVLLILPLLQVAGVDYGSQGGAGRLAHLVERALHLIGIAPTLPLLLAVFVVLIAARATLGRMETVEMLAVEQRVASELRIRLYRAIAGSAWVEVCRYRGSDLIHALTAETERAGLAAYDVLMLAASVAVAAVYILIALKLSPAMTLVVLASAALLVIFLGGASHTIEHLGRRQSASNQSLYAAAVEHVQALKTAKAYGAGDRSVGVFADLSRGVAAARVNAARAQVAATSRFEIGAAVMLGAIIYVAVRVLMVPAADILILLVVFARLMPQTLTAYRMAHALASNLPAFTNVLAAEARCLANAEASANGAAAPSFRQTIQFTDVTFAYSPDTSPAVRNLNLEIPAGKTIALTGPSGAGKSTIADLLMGLLVADSGQISIDGVALSAAAACEWRNHIGYVASDTFLFHGTIRENLLWAKPDATPVEIDAAIDAAAADFVRAMSVGLDAVIGDRGVTISQGERQRLALARAFLRRPAILILDEATNSLDSASEARVMAAIAKMHGASTVVLVAHRLSTIRAADLIYVIEDGGVAEQGDWDTLIERPDGRLRALAVGQHVAH